MGQGLYTCDELDNVMGGKGIERIYSEDFHGRLPSRSETWEQLNNIQDITTRMYCIIAYVYGARVSEIVKYKVRRELTKQEKGKRWKIPNPEYARMIRRGNRPELEGIKPENFERVIKNGKDCLMLHCRNEKHKSVHYKNLPASFAKEGVILNPLWDWLQLQEKGKELFPVCRRYIDRWIKKHAPFFRSSHFLRGLRCTHLVNESDYKFNESYLQKFAGWSNTLPSKFYVMLSPEDLIDKTMG